MQAYEERNIFALITECVEFSSGDIIYRPILNRTTTAKIKVQK